MSNAPDPRPAILLDRDGTVIVDVPYLGDPARVVLERNAAAGLRQLVAAGFALVVVSNQSGIGRGLIDIASVEAVNARAATLLAAEGVSIAGWYYCPHGPDQGCDCRKPAPGLALRAADELGLDLTRSVVIGDKPSDVGLASAIAAGGLLVTTGEGAAAAPWARSARIPVVADLLDAARLIGRPVPSGIAALALRARAFLRQEALPLWSGAGFDPATDSFEERLGFYGAPDLAAPRRLMVQARQVAVFARAALAGDLPAGAEIARRAGRAMVANYLGVDGQPGWVFSVDRTGRVLDATRDLYAHAFTLFALAWLKRLDGDASWDGAIAATLHVLDSSFAHPGGGYHESLPRRDSIRRQNPHMHLFEALIELAMVTGDPAVHARCAALDDLARRHFVSGATGLLHEQFGPDWQVSGLAVEPGHQMEWAWLFARYAALAGVDRTASVDRLVAAAMTAGIDPRTGRVVDLCAPDFTVLRATSRSWPHAETAKALADQISRGNIAHLPVYRRVTARLLDRYCPPELSGGWIDQFDADDRPLSTAMPASSLYHVYFGLASLFAPVA